MSGRKSITILGMPKPVMGHIGTVQRRIGER